MYVFVSPQLSDSPVKAAGAAAAALGRVGWGGGTEGYHARGLGCAMRMKGSPT